MPERRSHLTWVGHISIVCGHDQLSEHQMARKKNFKFEESLAQLEELVEQMEDGELSLEEALKAFEKGIKLTRECQRALKQAEQKIHLLMEKNDEAGEETEAVPFEPDDDMDA